MSTGLETDSREVRATQCASALRVLREEERHL